MPCHEERVKNAAAHTHHQGRQPGKQVHLLPHAHDRLRAHEPERPFDASAGARSDHALTSHRMPATSATKTKTLPGQTNTCANGAPRDYQAPLLKRASLIDAARKRDWSKLPEMLAYVQSKDRDEVFATSLIRLMRASADERITPVLLTAMKDPSPLVRSAAVEAISMRPSREGVQALLDATGDEYRLVRTRAAAGLAGYPLDRLTGEVKTRVEKANKEYLAFIMARPDQWTSHYNMGNYQLSRGEFKEAVASYQTALKLEPTGGHGHGELIHCLCPDGGKRQGREIPE